jgi:hypothetical protein
VQKYKQIARRMGRIWREHGALSYTESMGDDVKPGKVTSFPQAVKLKKGEVVWLSWATYKNRAHRPRQPQRHEGPARGEDDGPEGSARSTGSACSSAASGRDRPMTPAETDERRPWNVHHRARAGARAGAGLCRLVGPEGQGRVVLGARRRMDAIRREMDFRVDGGERLTGRWKSGRVTDFSARYLDIVPQRRIVYAYTMHVDEKKISVSLATIVLEPARVAGKAGPG